MVPAAAGWWYEGGGFFRHNTLSAISPAAHVVPFGLHYTTALQRPFQYRSPPPLGITIAAAKVSVMADVSSASGGAVVNAVFVLYADDGVTVVGSATAGNVAVAGDGVTTATAAIAIADAECWSVPRPYLYTLALTVATPQGTHPMHFPVVNHGAFFNALSSGQSWSVSCGLHRV